MPTKHELINAILSNPNAPRGDIVRFLKIQLARITSIGVNNLAHKSQGSQFREVITEGEKLAGLIQHVLLSQKNVNWNDDPELAMIEDIVATLTDQTDNVLLWKDLMAKIDDL